MARNRRHATLAEKVFDSLGVITAISGSIFVLCLVYGYFSSDHPDKKQNSRAIPEFVERVQDFSSEDGEYMVGVAKADITGPISQVNLMGMANPAQIAAGLWMRIYARTLIVKDSAGTSVVYTSCDNGMMSQWVKDEVMRELATVFPDKRYRGKKKIREDHF